MKVQPGNDLTQPKHNSLATIFFIFGALHIYSLLRTKKTNNSQLLETGMKIFSPVWGKILAFVIFGTTFVEAIEILPIPLR